MPSSLLHPHVGGQVARGGQRVQVVGSNSAPPVADSLDHVVALGAGQLEQQVDACRCGLVAAGSDGVHPLGAAAGVATFTPRLQRQADAQDRKSTRLNSSHVKITYAVLSFEE